MKAKSYWLLMPVLLAFSCVKKQDYDKVKFPKTSYTVLSEYDASGKPQNLLKDNVSPELWNFVEEKLPEGKNLTISNPELFQTSKTADITVTQSADVYVTFLRGLCYYPNSLAYYTYPTSNPPASPKDIKEIVYFFPNVGQSTPLQKGDKVKLGRFSPGTSIGFVLMQQSWDAAKRKLNNDVLHFCSHDALNPEKDPALKKHAVLFNFVPEDKVVVGFEDMLRTSEACDHDFNDVVFYCTVVI